MASFKNLISNTSAQISSGGTITGDLVINGDLQVDGGGSLSFDEIIEGTQVIDVTNTEALLVRKNGDGGDVFTVDTTNSKVIVGDINLSGSTISDSSALTISSGDDITIDATSDINLDADGGDIRFKDNGTNFVTFNSSTGSTFLGKIAVGGSHSPTSLLHLENASSPTVRIKDTTNNVLLLAFAQNSDAGFGTYSGHPMKFYSNSGLALTLGTDQSATFSQSIDGDAYIALDNVTGGSSSVNETAALRLNLGDGSTIRGGAKITAKKEADYSTGANMDASLTFSVLENNGYNNALVIAPSGGATFSQNINIGDDKALTLGAGSDSQIFNTGSHLFIRNNTSDQDIIFQVNDGGSTQTEVMRIDGATSSATFSGEISASNTLRLHKANASGLTDYIAIRNSGTSGVRSGLGLGTADSSLVLFVDKNNAIGAGSALVLQTGGTDALTINGSQNATFSGEVSVEGGILTIGKADTASGHINAFENMSFNIDTDNDDTNRFFEFSINGSSGSGTELMRLTEAGNLGINDTNPEAHLTVSPSTVGTTSFGGRSINYGVNINTASGRSGVTVKPANNYAIGDDNAGFQWLYPFDDGGNGDFKAFRVSEGATLVDKFYATRDGQGYFASNVGIGKSTLESTDSNWRSLELGGNGALINHSASGAGKALIVSQNAYMVSNNFNTGMDYMDTDEASCYLQHSGTHTFRVTGSGTADASITWTDALAIANDSSATFSGDVNIKSIGGNNDPATLALWSPDTSISADDNIGVILAQGSDSGGSPPYLGGKIEFNADAVWDTGTTGYYPTRIDFFTESNSGTVSTASPRMTLDSSGRVGMGASPSYPLHVENASDTVAYFKSTDNNGQIAVVDDDTTAYFGANGSRAFMGTASGLAGNTNLVVDSNGNVVIGQTTAQQKLEVHGGGIRIAGNITTPSSGVTGALIDYFGSDTRFWSRGADASTVGSFKFIGLENDGGNQSTQLEIDSSGNATFAGSISKGSGSFKIDHPLESKKDTHHLVHSFVEAPQADNIYRGKATLSNGSIEINIDTISGMSEGTFVLLNTDIQCFTSNESNWDAVKGSVSGNILTISCQNTDSTATVSWLVIGERQDQHMLDTSWTDENGKVIVEPEKPEEESGE